MYQIVRREVFSENAFLWEVLAPDVAAAAQPGHFVMLRLHENGERIRPVDPHARGADPAPGRGVGAHRA